MTGGLWLSMLAGACIGLSIALLLGRLLPVHADLKSALDRLAPTRRAPDATTPDTRAADSTERLGHWAMSGLPAEVWVRTPHRELALLNKSLSRFYGEKLTYAAVGLAVPVFLTTLFTAMGVNLPFTLSAFVSVALAGVMFFLPDYNARDDAAKARVEFRRALGAYVELVALERTNGSGVRQAMEAAAGIGSSWVFTRIDEELSRSRLSGVPPWSALRTLGDDLGLPELHDFADIMRLSGEQGAAVYSNLRARADSMRSALLAEELAEANDTGERMSIPGSALGIVFMALLMAPALLRMFTAT